MGWFFGDGGLYTLVAAFPGLGVGRELFCCRAFLGFGVMLVIVLGFVGRLLMDVSGPCGCCITGSGLAG